MTKKSENSKTEGGTDEIQRQFWQYRRVRIGVVLILIAASFALPKIPLLRGWEQKFSATAVEIGKADLPTLAQRVETPEEILAYFGPEIKILPVAAKVDGPMPLAAWKCAPLGTPGACIRYLWKNEVLTMVISSKAGKSKHTNEPFIKAGWGGYFIIKDGYALALVGPWDPNDILAAWPFGKFAPTANIQ